MDEQLGERKQGGRGRVRLDKVRHGRLSMREMADKLDDERQEPCNIDRDIGAFIGERRRLDIGIFDQVDSAKRSGKGLEMRETGVDQGRDEGADELWETSEDGIERLCFQVLSCERLPVADAP